MTESGDTCEGFYFRYFVADEEGNSLESDEDPDFLKAENEMLTRVSKTLKNRPDLMKAVSCLDNGLEVRFFRTSEKNRVFKDHDNEVYLFGQVTYDDDHVVMELSADEILFGGGKDHPVLDVVVHELTHLIDFLDDLDGVLPGWTPEQVKLFETAREVEKEKIRRHQSPLDAYALVSNIEFLAVLAETFFLKPDPLRISNPALYNLLKDYFKLEPPLRTIPADGPKPPVS